MPKKKLTPERIRSVVFQRTVMQDSCSTVAKRTGLSTSYVHVIAEVHDAIMGRNWDTLIQLYGSNQASFVAVEMASLEEYKSRIPTEVHKKGLQSREKLQKARDERNTARKIARKNCEDDSAICEIEDAEIVDPMPDESAELPEQLTKMFDALNNALLCIHKDLAELTAEVKEMHDHMNVNTDLTQKTIRDQTESIKTAIKKGRCVQ